MSDVIIIIESIASRIPRPTFSNAGFAPEWNAKRARPPTRLHIDISISVADLISIAVRREPVSRRLRMFRWECKDCEFNANILTDTCSRRACLRVRSNIILRADGSNSAASTSKRVNLISAGGRENIAPRASVPTSLGAGCDGKIILARHRHRQTPELSDDDVEIVCVRALECSRNRNVRESCRDGGQIDTACGSKNDTDDTM